MDLPHELRHLSLPLWLYALLLLFSITVERLIALRSSSVIPQRMVDAFVEGDLDKVESDLGSVTGRIICFLPRPAIQIPKPSIAFARLEVSRMERGLFFARSRNWCCALVGLVGHSDGFD